VAWDQEPGPDGAEPERPAPAVALVAAADEEGDDGSATAAAAPAAPDDTARWLGGGGLLVGALGLGLGGGALLRTRRSDR
jgi:predicted lipid-binding transport protein (Tim44 family)